MWFDSYSYVASNYDFSIYPNDIKLIQRGIIIDTAPLFILVVGHYDELNNTTYIEKFQSKSEKKQKTYKKYDYKFLLAFLNSFGLGKYHIYITQQIFTEFIQHLWKAVDNPEHFSEVLKTSFMSKKYFKEKSIVCVDCLLEKDFLDKTIEIGDISITIIANSRNNPYCCILTDDKPFAIWADRKYNQVVIYYDDVRNATYASNPKKIPAQLLVEPIC